MIYDVVVQYSSQDTDSQDGPKNPLKGISMKSLVLAFFAQIRVGAGYEYTWAGYNGI